MSLKNVTTIAIFLSAILLASTTFSYQNGEIIGWGTMVVSGEIDSGIVAIAASGAHSNHNLALKTDGSIAAWGDNEHGACEVPAPNSDFIAVAVGGNRSMGLKADGSIVAWGDAAEVLLNQMPVPNADYIEIATGAYHIMGLKSDGVIVAWGNGYSGPPGPNADFVAIAAGYSHCLGLKDDGSIVAWGGDNHYGECDVPSPNTDFVAVSTGYDHSLGLKSDGSIVTWGYNNEGQCDVPAPNTDFVAVAGGREHSLGLKSNGMVVVWGANVYGQCDLPILNTDFVAIGAGENNSIGLKTDGSVVGWGYNWYSQCNIGAPNTGFKTVDAGYCNNLGLKSDGSIVAWGDNRYGQCDVPAPNTDFVATAAGGYHNLGLKSDGSVVAWGRSSENQCNVPSPNTNFVAIAAGDYHSLGLKSDGSVVVWGSPHDVPAPNTDFVAVAAGGFHNLGLKADGSIAAWGMNSDGQCDVPAPNTGFVAVEGGYGHSLSLKANGTVVAWGDNADGQCDVPAPNTDFVAVVAGYNHSLGLKADGSIVAWGNNDHGQCDVPTGNCFAAIAAGATPPQAGQGYSLTIMLKTLTLLDPNGGEELIAGSTHPISWESKGDITNVKLEYTPDNGNNWEIIEPNTNNDGNYQWLVPYINSELCLVKITDIDDPCVYDTSDATFTIFISYPTLLSPNGGEELLAGTNYTVQWNTIGNIDEIQIDCSFDNGLSWWPVDPANIGNTEGYDWLVPWISSNQCLVRVSDANDPNIYDTSDDVFTIGPFPSQYPTLKDILGDPVPPVMESGYDFAELLIPDANSVATLLLEASGDKDENIFGIYNPENTSEKLELFAGPDSPPDTVIIQFDLMAGTVKNLHTGATANIGPGFGFYLTTYYVPGEISIACHWVTLYTDAFLNTNGGEYGLLYDASAYKGVINGDPDTVVAFEDTLGLGDRDYDDMVVGITNITPVTSYCTKEIKGDLNGDCLVDGLDFTILAAHWQECYNVASFQGLGDLPGGEFWTKANDISANGKIAIGSSWSDSGGESFRWSSTSGITGLGDLPGNEFRSYAYGVSANGSVVVGGSSSAYGWEAFRWENGSMVGLGSLPGGSFYSVAEAVSADGSLIVGYSESQDDGQAFCWTAEKGMQGLGDLEGGSFISWSRDVSADGSVIVGYSQSSNGNEAFRWTSSEGMQGLGDLLGGDFVSDAYGISADGSVIVGFGTSALGIQEAFRWSASEGMQGLGYLYLGCGTEAYDVSADGSVIVGASGSASGWQAFAWDNANGIRNWKEVLENEFGLDLTGWILNKACGVSDDGITIVGHGTNIAGNPEAWIATVPRPNYPCNIPGDSTGDCCVNILDLAILCSHWLNCNLFPESACWK